MSKRSDEERMQDIVIASNNAIKYLKGVSFNKFSETTIIQDAVVRNIEIIGEAAKNISEKCKEENPDIPWKNIMGSRDRLIHEYFGVNLDIVWGIVKNDLPDLVKKLRKALKKEKQISEKVRTYGH